MVIEPETNPFWVYVLVSETTGRRYIGQTQDLNRRLTEHNNPEHNLRKFTSRNVGPWRLVYSEKHATRAEAMQRERWLKSGAGRAWLNRSIGRLSPPVAD
ncbi:MAG: GIY-YIG nuclease family protein [Planctomycetaceae bacterium]